MAHIDDCTQVETMMQIVKKFDQHEVCRKDIKAIVIGGWQDHPESYRWGMKVVDFLKEQQFENLSTKNMFKKKIVTFPIQDFGQATNHYYFGAQVDAKGGRTSVVSQFNPDFQVLDDRQMQANEAYAKKYGTSAPELPLKGVL